jgi:threonine synthase
MPGRKGLNRYRDSLPIPPDAKLVSLGEGGTPLIPQVVDQRTIYFKCEHLNPTGSFKDRGTVLIVSSLLAEGVREAVEDSSGNAGASFAAYCARAGIRASVYVPEYAAGPKRAQIEQAGAEVIVVPGPRSAASDAARQRAESGAAYASHAHLPHGLAGMATMALEIADQLGGVPGTLVLPIGQGTLLLGAYYGFRSLQAAGRIDAIPQIVGVQARACAPIWQAFVRGMEEPSAVEEGETLAEGIRIARPIRLNAVLAAIRASGGRVVAIDEHQIESGRDALARAGFYVEPTSAVIWPALREIRDVPDPVVAVLTGSGFKDPILS